MDGAPSLKSYPCPLCGTSRSRVVVKKTGIAVPLEFTIVACESCRHLRVDPRIRDEEIDELYDEAYYRGDGFDRTIDYDAPSPPEARAQRNAIIDTVAEALGGSVEGVRWLDVGCGAGGLVEEARRRGVLAFGTDSSPFAVARCTRKGLPLLSATEVSEQKGSFGVVSAIDVIEHVPDPRGLVELLRSCVDTGGIVYVHTGNWNLVRRQPGSPYVMPEGHIQYFTPQAMRRLFAESSLAEANVFNRTWLVNRLLPERIREAMSPAALRSLAKVAQRWTPGLAPFPVGVRSARA